METIASKLDKVIAAKKSIENVMGKNGYQPPKTFKEYGNRLDTIINLWKKLAKVNGEGFVSISEEDTRGLKTIEPGDFSNIPVSFEFIANDLEQLAVGAFENSTIVGFISNSLNTVLPNAFENNNNMYYQIQHIEVPNAKLIGDFAFKNCENLYYLNIDGVTATNFSANALTGCTHLGEIYARSMTLSELRSKVNSIGLNIPYCAIYCKDGEGCIDEREIFSVKPDEKKDVI